MSSRSDPCRPLVAFFIAIEQLQRYMLSNQRDDLDHSISHFTESILLLPISWLQHGPILEALFFLAHALFVRSIVFKQPEDAIYATKYLYYLRDQPREIPSIPRRQLITSLVHALAVRVELETGNAMQNIREIAVLSHELASETSDSDVDTTPLFFAIYKVLMRNILALTFAGHPDQPLDEAIECAREARKLRPDLLQGRFVLAWSLVSRYRITHAGGDYEEAASILDAIITSSPGNTDVAKFQAAAIGFAAVLARSRSDSIRLRSI